MMNYENEDNKDFSFDFPLKTFRKLNHWKKTGYEINYPDNTIDIINFRLVQASRQFGECAAGTGGKSVLCHWY